MTQSTRLVDPAEIKSTDSQASAFMQEGIRMMQSKEDVNGAILCFDRALALRRLLPTEVPAHAYGLAACWLNRAEALTCLGPSYHVAALESYDEALILLRSLPLDDDVSYSRRLAIAYQNRALVLAAQNPPATADAIVSLSHAVEVLGATNAMDKTERDFLLGVVWMNLANIQVSQATIASDAVAREAALRALALVKAQEREQAAAAEAGLKARHVLCHIAARRLSIDSERETVIDDVHEATDLADEGLSLVREWEKRGVDCFRNLASDLLQFGGQVYARYQSHFLQEFLSEQLDSQQSTHSYVQSPEMQSAARAIALLLPTVWDKTPTSK